MVPENFIAPLKACNVQKNQNVLVVISVACNEDVGSVTPLRCNVWYGSKVLIYTKLWLGLIIRDTLKKCFSDATDY